MILGVGSDVVNCERVKKLYEKYGLRFLNRILSFDEQRVFTKFPINSRQQTAYLAKRFAAKEAVSKAVGTGIGKLSFTDISITNNQLGAPVVNMPKDFLISGSLEYTIHLSLSDEWPIAVAFVIISK